MFPSRQVVAYARQAGPQAAPERNTFWSRGASETVFAARSRCKHMRAQTLHHQRRGSLDAFLQHSRGGLVRTSPVPQLRLDCARELPRITETLRQQVGEVLRRSGIVVAMSGGVDSSVCAALAVRAVGRERVLGLALPERESDPQSVALARGWAERLG